MSERETLRGLLIGCGFVSRHHLDGWRRVEGASIAAVCDLDPERARAAAALAPGASAYVDARRALEEIRPDFVEICTRPDAHLPLTRLAAEFGAHVLCQKPSASTLAEIRGMSDACDAAGVRFMIHENWRFRPWYRALRERVAAGRVGRPNRLRIIHRDTRALRPGGFSDQPYFAEMPRLILFEMGPHLIDCARFLLGEVVAVTGRVDRFGEGHVGDDTALLTLEFESGAVGSLEMNWCAPPDLARPEWALNQTAVEGTSGTLSVRTDGSLDFVGLDGRTETIPVALPAEGDVYVEGYAAVQRHFVDAIRSGGPIETDGPDNLRTMAIIEAGYASAATGRTVRLDSRLGMPPPLY